MIRVETKGLEEVQAALRDNADRLGKELKVRVRRAGLLVQHEAKTNQIERGGYKRITMGGRTWMIPTPPPKAGHVYARRGGLSRSINTQVEKRGSTYQARTGTPLKYGRWLEFGTQAKTFKAHAIPLAVITNNAADRRERSGRAIKSGKNKGQGRLRPAWRIVSKRGPIKPRYWLKKSFEAKDGAILAEINRAVEESVT